MSEKRRAVISVSDKKGATELGKMLSETGWEILSTGGTAKALREGGVPVTDVSAYTGQPEILGGRVKTLHPKLLGGILARLPDQAEEMKGNGIEPVDLVAVNFYPFRETIARPGVTPAEAVEQIDIGGPTMVRASAKNHGRVTVLVDPEDYPKVIEQLSKDETVSDDLRRNLARKAFGYVSDYDAAISAYLSGLDAQPGADEEADDDLFPKNLSLGLERMQVLRYGENPHQRAAFYRSAAEGLSIADAEVLGGKELSYNNLLDLAGAAELIADLGGTACAILKHTNPCGVGIADTPAEAYVRGLACDPVSAFGSIIGYNCRVDATAAEAMRELFVEAVIAPEFDEEALAIFRKKKNLRILRLPGLTSQKREGLDYRAVPGGVLVQTPDSMSAEEFEWKVVTPRGPTADEEKALHIAWTVSRHVKSNAIVLADQAGTVGIGAGQMSRVDSSRIAADRAVLPLEGCALGSDAFFPFRDGVDEAAKRGVKAIAQPGGSKRDDEVIEAAAEHGIAMVFTGRRHFRH
ncbi:MAG: bifunctional phosphoribosylaminoimidazolecarboxamide formyltransferase/IMP cyclohydrolase [Nitrospinaceae bacterium]|jgi:phosphoribosylaminoimidazolecarboxamide formyltransferase / IMP cyclohydrolase|nr:bifunctional phosphoribosylaminoimidazolecarboxamide formyltransferase/IMP cyclohydrolase [Nitrospinaceae bacterium]MBT5369288.1 bifunctional phosphoribosylaminoimidazolecarboxamide formyltransferase/IMP cyclohydrolase [Nitrospinaceae bacterium]MBT5949488.1 bifunctional phosphoribosylaminoimidazolecarboxamide formyltransferase/IMP cyclohydrolase [Nitrospinaceae bacterium]MBT6393687.1 bifunctional phosphoribosylaminoimidazolecarboxamide formyltransferase/IMP cyclohydrolase [Nitrospinaceae bact